MILHSVGSSIHCDPSAPFVLGVYIILSGPSARIRASSKHPSARWMCEVSKILFEMVYRRATGEGFCDARVDVADFTVRGTQRHGRVLEVHHLRYGIIWDMMCEGGCIKGGCIKGGCIKGGCVI